MALQMASGEAGLGAAMLSAVGPRVVCRTSLPWSKRGAKHEVRRAENLVTSAKQWSSRHL
jgi:hypothetical protein